MGADVGNPFGTELAARRYAAGRLDVHAEFARRIARGLGGRRPLRTLDIGCGTRVLLLGRIEGEPGFFAWFEAYKKRLRRPSRHPDFDATRVRVSSRSCARDSSTRYPSRLTRSSAT